MQAHSALRASLLAVVATATAAVDADASSFLQVFSGVGHHVRDRAGGDGDELVARWVGCFKDDSDRDLEWNPQGSFTVSGCKSECYYTHYKFMAMQGGSECWCGNSYETAAQYFQMHDSECDNACISDEHPEVGNSSGGALRQLCGGHFANAVYELKMQEHEQVQTTMTTVTETTVTGTTVTVSSVTGTTTSYTKVKIDMPSLSAFDVCEDKDITSLTINGKPQPCSNLRHYCSRRNFTKAMESECPATCGLCKPVWIGCFRDDTVEHDLEKKPPGRHTTRSCMEACSGFLYMALQNGTDCWCGMKYSTDATRFFPMLDADCGPICPGEEELSPPRHCGRHLINAIYKLPAIAPPEVAPAQEGEDDTIVDSSDHREQRLSVVPPAASPNISSLVGCYEDKEDRVFTMQAVGKHVTETCLRECTNFSYMALENMGTCWCGNTYDDKAMKTLPLSDCGDVCHGEAGMLPVRFCGGKHASAIYRLMQTGEAAEESSATSATASDGEPEGDAATAAAAQNYLDGIVKDEGIAAVAAEQNQVDGDAAAATEEDSLGVSMSGIVASFTQMDLNQDLALSADELLAVVAVVSQGMDKEKVMDLIKQVDLDGSGALELTEFAALFTRTDGRALLGPIAQGVGNPMEEAAGPEQPVASNATATEPMAAAPAPVPFRVLAGNDTAGQANMSFEAPQKVADPSDDRPMRADDWRRRVQAA